MIDNQTIGVQLYSAREELGRDFSGTMRKIASYGYRGVEAAGFPAGVTVEAAKSLFDDLNITVLGAHSALPLGDNQDAIMHTVETLSCEYLICPYLDPDTYFTDVHGIKAACEMLNEANKVVKSAGVKLAYHNHDFEMRTVDGKIAYQHMLEFLDNDVLFELDTYWAQVAGLNPVDVMAELGDRLPLLHLKDGPAENRSDSMVALGAGVMDIPAMLERSSSKWHVVELDRCETDMLTAIKDSYSYLMELNS